MGVEDNFSTIPLRFRVWDNHRSIFVPWDENYCFARDEDGKLYLSNIDWSSKDLPEEDESRFIISQDTGLKDKNGKSIYTGDIVQKDEYTRAKCYWDSSAAEVEFELISGSDLVKSFIEEYEVIGNIWQTPGLLEEK